MKIKFTRPLSEVLNDSVILMHYNGRKIFDLKASVALIIVLLASLLSGCTKQQDPVIEDDLIEYYTLYEVSGIPQAGALTLFFDGGSNPANFTASVTSIPSNGPWTTDKNVLTLGGSIYRIDKHNDGHLWFHRGGVTYKFNFDGNNR